MRTPSVQLSRRTGPRALGLVAVAAVGLGWGASRAAATPPAVPGRPAVKARITHATGFTVSYRDTHKLVTVVQPWKGAAPLRYALVPHGAEAPDVAGAEVIRTPVRRVVAMSTTVLPHLVICDKVDALVGIDRFKYVNTPAVRERVAAGAVAELGEESLINIEKAIAARPDLIFSFVLDADQVASRKSLRQVGLQQAVSASYLETTALGRCEWLKFTALFFDAEARAETYFAGVVSNYTRLAELVRDVDERPTVFSGAPFKDTWYMAGGRSYMAGAYRDAGADYLWADDIHTGGVPLSFETIYARAAHADFWLHPSDWRSLADGLGRDRRFQLFDAFQEGQVYNHNAILNEHGGSDFWESGVVHPDRVLADLIRIFHPDKLPAHKLHWYRKLQ